MTTIKSTRKRGATKAPAKKAPAKKAPAKKAPAKKAPAKKAPVKQPAKEQTKKNFDLNSIVMVKFESHKNTLKQTLTELEQEITIKNGAEVGAIEVKTPFIKSAGTVIGDLNARIEKFRSALRRAPVRAVPNPMMQATYYVTVDKLDVINSLYDEAVDDIESLKRKLVKDWDALVADGKRRLGKQAEEVNVPDAKDFAAKFSLKIHWLGKPSSIDGTVLGSVQQETAARVRQSSIESEQQALLEATAGPVREILAVATEAFEFFTSADRKRIRSERFERLKELAEWGESTNWLGDPKIEKLMQDVLTYANGVEDVVARGEDGRKEAIKGLDTTAKAAQDTLKALGIG